MPNMQTTYPVLLEAYKHYENTGDKHFEVLPKSSDYLLSVINSVESLQENGYIVNVSDNLTNDKSIYLAPLESMSFDITTAGIEFVRSKGN